MVSWRYRTNGTNCHIIAYVTLYHGGADLSKLSQHAHELILIDDSPVGPLALEGDHSWHRFASFRRRQICSTMLMYIYVPAGCYNDRMSESHVVLQYQLSHDTSLL